MGKIAHYEFPIEQTPCGFINSRNMHPSMGGIKGDKK